MKRKLATIALLMFLAPSINALEVSSFTYEPTVPYIMFTGTGGTLGESVELVDANGGGVLATSEIIRISIENQITNGWFFFDDAAIAINPPAQVTVRTATEESAVYTLPPLPPPGGSVTGADIHQSNGMLTFGLITVQVDPAAYTSGDSLDWSYTQMPYLPDGFVAEGNPLSLTSSVTTSVSLSVNYSGPGSILWPTLLPGGIDRMGDQGPWVAPQPSTENVAGLWRIDTRLSPNVTKQIGPAVAPLSKTETSEPVGPQVLQIHWHTKDGNLPSQAALVQNALSTYLQTQLDDLTCPSIPSTVSLLVLPPRVFSNEPNFLARYHSGTIFYNPVAFTQSDFDLELTTVHEAAHLMQAHLMHPMFDEWSENPAILPLLVVTNPWTEAYSVQAEIDRYTTPFYDGWAAQYGEWPDRFPVADAIIGDRLYAYHLGLPLSWLRGADAAPTLCEFWGNPQLPAAILTSDAGSIMPNFTGEWAQFTHNWNVPGMRDNIADGLTALVGDASPISLTARLPLVFFPHLPTYGIVHNLAPICRGGTMHLDFSEETDPGGSGVDFYSFHNVDSFAEHNLSIVFSKAGSQSINNPGVANFSEGGTRASTNFWGLGVGTPSSTYYVTYDSPKPIDSIGMYIGRTYDIPGPSCGP